MTISNVKAELLNLRQQLINHYLYQNINSTEDLNLFLEHHVFAVWDFMSLLKALQQKLTCTTTPWIPLGNPNTRYLINEIVLAEETDLNLDGNHISHYEMYLEAMADCKASPNKIELFLNDLSSYKNVFVTINNSELPEALKDFLRFTFNTIEEGEAHEIAAAFTFGREELIPNMFTEILNELQKNFPDVNYEKLIYYFKRHIELDEDEHGPMAMQMISDLCGTNEKKWNDVLECSKKALEVRINLWNCIESEINKQSVLV